MSHRFVLFIASKCIIVFYAFISKELLNYFQHYCYSWTIILKSKLNKNFSVQYWLTIDMMLYSISLDLMHLYNWKFTPNDIQVHIPIIPQPLETTIPFCFYYLTSFDSSCKWKHAMFLLLWQAYVTLINILVSSTFIHLYSKTF